MRISSSRSLILLVWLLVCACRQVDVGDSAPGGASPRIATPEQTLEIGSWGGEGLGMEVSESGATLEFDCAHATIQGPIPLDASRRFAVEGSYFQEHGGPISAGEETAPVKTRYEGTVTGGTMSLTVINLDAGEKIGAYTLVLGAVAHITKCL